MAGPTEAEIRQWLRGYVDTNLQVEQLTTMVARFNDLIVDMVPELADPELRRDLEESTAAQIRLFMGGVIEDLPPPVPPTEARALARSIARRGLDLRVLMQTYHAGQQAGVQFLTDTVAEAGLDQEFERAVILRLYARTSTWLNLSMEQLTDTYTEERERGLRDAFTRRAETVRAVLAGDEDVDVEAASRRLGYRLAGRHLACVLWTDSAGDDDVIGTLDRFANRIASALGSGTALTVPSGARGLWAWIATDTTADPRSLAGMRGDAAAHGLRVAFGVRAAGVEGFRRGHREALAAREVAQFASGTGWLTDYRDVELVHLLRADPDAMRALVSRELTGIDGFDATSARLRETLAVYLHCAGSPEAAGRELGVHKNTVRYRIQRIEELLGHDIESRRLHLELALLAAAAYPRGT